MCMNMCMRNTVQACVLRLRRQLWRSWGSHHKCVLNCVHCGFLSLLNEESIYKCVSCFEETPKRHPSLIIVCTNFLDHAKQWKKRNNHADGILDYLHELESWILSYLVAMVSLQEDVILEWWLLAGSGDCRSARTAVKTGTALGAISITEVTLLEVCFWKEHLCRQELPRQEGRDRFQINCFAVPRYYLRRCHPAVLRQGQEQYTPELESMVASAAVGRSWDTEKEMGLGLSRLTSSTFRILKVLFVIITYDKDSMIPVKILALARPWLFTL